MYEGKTYDFRLTCIVHIHIYVHLCMWVYTYIYTYNTYIHEGGANYFGLIRIVYIYTNIYSMYIN